MPWWWSSLGQAEAGAGLLSVAPRAGADFFLRMALGAPVGGEILGISSVLTTRIAYKWLRGEREMCQESSCTGG